MRQTAKNMKWQRSLEQNSLCGVWRQDLADLEWDNKPLLRTLFLLTFPVFLAVVATHTKKIVELNYP